MRIYGLAGKVRISVKGQGRVGENPNGGGPMVFLGDYKP